MGSLARVVCPFNANEDDNYVKVPNKKNKINFNIHAVFTGASRKTLEVSITATFSYLYSKSELLLFIFCSCILKFII